MKRVTIFTQQLGGSFHVFITVRGRNGRKVGGVGYSKLAAFEHARANMRLTRERR